VLSNFKGSRLLYVYTVARISYSKVSKQVGVGSPNPRTMIESIPFPFGNKALPSRKVFENSPQIGVPEEAARIHTQAEIE
jgi:hypothetical protein